MDSTPFERLAARLVTLDMDPETLEILTAVLTADLDARTDNADDEPRHDHIVSA